MRRENDIEPIDQGMDGVVQIWIDGESAKAARGETVLSTLFAIGKRRISKNDHGYITGAYCCMGICCCCALNIDGTDNRLACQTIVQEGMRVETQSNRHDKEGLTHV